MRTKRSNEAYLEINHQNSPGITHEFAHRHHLPGPVVAAGQTFKSAMVTCHCCQGDVVLNPDRSRERAWCWKHDSYLCDACAAAQKAGADCIPFSQRFEQWFERLIKGLPILVN